MSCKICNRSSCTESFHSLEDQDAWEERQSMSDDVDTLRRACQEWERGYKKKRQEIAKLEVVCEILKESMLEMLRRSYNEMELRKIAREALNSLENSQADRPNGWV